MFLCTIILVSSTHSYNCSDTTRPRKFGLTITLVRNPSLRSQSLWHKLKAEDLLSPTSNLWPILLPSQGSNPWSRTDRGRKEEVGILFLLPLNPLKTEKRCEGVPLPFPWPEHETETYKCSCNSLSTTIVRGRLYTPPLVLDTKVSTLLWNPKVSPPQVPLLLKRQSRLFLCNPLRSGFKRRSDFQKRWSFLLLYSYSQKNQN